MFFTLENNTWKQLLFPADPCATGRFPLDMLIRTETHGPDLPDPKNYWQPQFYKPKNNRIFRAKPI